VILARWEGEDGLAFFGAIVAGQSHEVINVLNIINELTGLQKDILQTAASGMVDVARLAGIADKIEGQVIRGVKIVSEVNRFAHSIDVPVAVFDLRELLDRVVFLAERSARMRRTRLASSTQGTPVMMEGNPFLLQQIVFCCVDMAAASASDEETVSVRCRAESNTAEVTITFGDANSDVGEYSTRVARIEALLHGIGGEFVVIPEAGGRTNIVLRVPLRGDAQSAVDGDRREGVDAS
jgi:C4-dicarboxylate-specific signal transduction histidine kinase